MWSSSFSGSLQGCARDMEIDADYGATQCMYFASTVGMYERLLQLIIRQILEKQWFSDQGSRGDCECKSSTPSNWSE